MDDLSKTTSSQGFVKGLLSLGGLLGKGQEMAKEVRKFEDGEAARDAAPAKKRGPGRPKGSGKRGPGRPAKRAVKASRVKPGPRRPKKAGRRVKAAKGTVTPREAKRLV